jgi:hypothetical protein
MLFAVPNTVVLESPTVIHYSKHWGKGNENWPQRKFQRNCIFSTVMNLVLLRGSLLQLVCFNTTFGHILPSHPKIVPLNDSDRMSQK